MKLPHLFHVHLTHFSPQNHPARWRNRPPKTARSFSLATSKKDQHRQKDEANKNHFISNPTPAPTRTKQPGFFTSAAYKKTDRHQAETIKTAAIQAQTSKAIN